MLIPLIGTGEGGLSPRDAVPKIVDGILEFYKKSASKTEVRTIYLLAYYESDKTVCEDELAANGFIAKPGVIHWT